MCGAKLQVRLSKGFARTECPWNLGRTTQDKHDEGQKSAQKLVENSIPTHVHANPEPFADNDGVNLATPADAVTTGFLSC